MQQRKIIQIHPISIQIINIWESATIASIVTGICRGHICSCAGNERAHAGGYYWKYFDEYNSNLISGDIKNNKIIIQNKKEKYICI